MYVLSLHSPIVRRGQDFICDFFNVKLDLFDVRTVNEGVSEKVARKLYLLKVGRDRSASGKIISKCNSKESM